MNKVAVLGAAAIVGLGSIGIAPAEARDGRHGAFAAGLIGGLAAGAIVGSASRAYSTPAPAYSYDYGYAPAPAYRPSRVVRTYDYVPDDEYVVEYAPPQRHYRTTRVVRSYDYVEPRYYSAPVEYGW